MWVCVRHPPAGASFCLKSIGKGKKKATLGSLCFWRWPEGLLAGFATGAHVADAARKGFVGLEIEQGFRSRSLGLGGLGSLVGGIGGRGGVRGHGCSFRDKKGQRSGIGVRLSRFFGVFAFSVSGACPHFPLPSWLTWFSVSASVSGYLTPAFRCFLRDGLEILLVVFLSRSSLKSAYDSIGLSIRSQEF